MSKRLKTIMFAGLLCLVCSILLTSASIGLQGFQQKNMLIDKHRNVLKSVGLVPENKSYTAEEIESIYARYIRALWVDPAGRLIKEPREHRQDIPLYVYLKDDKIQAYILPINSRGLWGRIYGYLAIENDGVTIAGFTVYKHSETPGLGGEIEKDWFQKNWVGKKIVDRGGDFVSVKIAKGDVEERVAPEKQPHYVDGISGATLTGNYLSAGIQETLQNYEPVSIKFRNNRMDVPID